MKLFKKILIANRGEIAVRVIRSAQKLGITTVAIYSPADADALHVKLADEAYGFESNELADSYLDIDRIIEIASRSGSEAIHPGYGFLSENPRFVEACENANIVFIGPDTRSIKLMGNKIESRAFVQEIGIPMTEGITGDIKTLRARATEIPFPILVKAAAGGGGKGMRIVREESELDEVLESTSREAQSYFGDPDIFIEKYVEEPRHIEIQVLADTHGNAIHLFERECSIQRRYQKIIEESPSPTLNDEVRMKMGEAAVLIATKIGYSSAGTVEFLVDKDLNFYFLEMNTRVQVEHPVTEMVTGVDIVREQILIAGGKVLDIEQDELFQDGHAIECRIYAEDPANNFMPSPGVMTLYKEPKGDDIRIDTGIETATRVESFYDPMIAKLVVWGEDREIAREKMIKALNRFVIHGIKTNIGYLNYLLKNPAYINNEISTKYCDEHTDSIIKDIEAETNAIPAYLPIIAYSMYEFSKKAAFLQGDKPSVWDQVGYWRDLMEVKVKLDEEEVPFEILSAGRDHYSFDFSGEQHKVKLKSIIPGRIQLFIDDQQHTFSLSEDTVGNAFVSYKGFVFTLNRDSKLVMHEEILGSFDGDKTGGSIVSPMPGKVIKVNIEPGDEVKKGQTLMIVEAMKMENNITAPFDGTVDQINVEQGQMVDGNARLLELTNK